MQPALMYPTLWVDLNALRSNYRLLKTRHAKQTAAAVVKANAYGLGVEAVSRALWQEGCREFFVATLSEAVELRAILPDAVIAVFNGIHAGEEADYLAYKLLPVLNEPAQLERWQKASPDAPAVMHVDTGMTRLGFTQTDLKKAVHTHQAFISHRLCLLMSHLSCANEPEHPKNAEQLKRFKEAALLLPGIRTSLSNSSGLFLGNKFHHDLARPGCAIYGINPTEQKNPMQHVATLSAPVLQVRELDRDETVGYGASYSATKGSRIAMVALGYADGWMRCLSNQGAAYIAGYRVPVAGRVSMDMVAIDVSSIPEHMLPPSARAEFINAQQPVDTIAAACGTIGYEIFTRLGRRIIRQYNS